eukprot:scaffold63493_cov69-Phaeocystis_antarctica.AAC.4
MEAAGARVVPRWTGRTQGHSWRTRPCRWRWPLRVHGGWLNTLEDAAAKGVRLSNEYTVAWTVY